MNESPTIEAVCQRIGDAFSDAPYPGDDHLVYDNSGSHLECNEVKAAFHRRHWRELNAADLASRASALFFLTPEGYRFYLPAYLIACVREYSYADTMLDTVVFTLLRPHDPRDEACYRKRIAALSPTQVAAVNDFLHFMRREHGKDDVVGDWQHALTDIATAVRQGPES